jgi:hypothetical protein
MPYSETKVPISRVVILLLVFLNALIIKVAFIRNESWYWALVVTLPLLLLATYHLFVEKARLRNNLRQRSRISKHSLQYSNKEKCKTKKARL